MMERERERKSSKMLNEDMAIITDDVQSSVISSCFLIKLMPQRFQVSRVCRLLFSCSVQIKIFLKFNTFGKRESLLKCDLVF